MTAASLPHPAIGRAFIRDGKAWKIASVHIVADMLWAAVVNIKEKTEQARFPLKEITGYDF